MNNLSCYILTTFIITSALMLPAWAFAKKRQEADIVDLVWTIGLGLAGLLSMCFADGLFERRIMTALIAGFWSIRLAIHLGERTFEQGEDGRYKALRAHWGTAADKKLFFFFQAQAILVAMLATTYFAAASNQSAIQYTDIAALVVFTLALALESISDNQLKSFRNNPANKGKTCTTGLWKYSRHPNYFFEWLHWFSFPLLAFGGNFFALSLVSPILMYIFVRYISGVPFTEMQALRSRGNSYKAYQESTSVFFPWFYSSNNSSKKENI